jgi:hypothetical protein
MPYPGTELAQMVEKEGGKLPETWESYRLMSSDVSSSKMLAGLKVSNLSEKELRYFLKTAQIEFQMGRLLATGETRATGVRNIYQIIKLSFIRASSFREVLKFSIRVISDVVLFFRGRLSRR